MRLRHPGSRDIPHIPASPQDSFSALAGVGQPSGQRAPAGFSGSWEIQSVGGRWCKAPVVSAGSSPGPRYRFTPYTAPHDNNTLRISAPAVAMTISRLPDLSGNAAPPVLHPKRAIEDEFS